MTFNPEYEIILPMSVIKRDKESIMVKCSCNTHALEVMCDDWGDSVTPMIYFGIWTHGQRPMPLRWRDRLRWIFYLIKDGRLHADDVVIDNADSIRQVSEFLREKADLIDQRLKEFNEKRKV